MMERAGDQQDEQDRVHRVRDPGQGVTVRRADIDDDGDDEPAGERHQRQGRQALGPPMLDTGLRGAEAACVTERRAQHPQTPRTA